MVYKWYILPIGGLYITYHLLREPGTTIDWWLNQPIWKICAVVKLHRNFPNFYQGENSKKSLKRNHLQIKTMFRSFHEQQDLIETPFGSLVGIAKCEVASDLSQSKSDVCSDYFRWARLATTPDLPTHTNWLRFRDPEISWLIVLIHGLSIP